jgi:hypothetical protein
MILGPGMGVAGATAAFLVMLGLGPLLRDGSSGVRQVQEWGPLFVFMTCIYASPGALALSLPLLFYLRWQRRRGRTRANLLALALVVGAPLGVVNLFASLALFKLTTTGITMKGDTLSPGLLLAATVGGLGLGLGCFWGLPRPKEERA